jgi:hypothetical protein
LLLISISCDDYIAKNVSNIKVAEHLGAGAVHQFIFLLLTLKRFDPLEERKRK